jgi:hypothetical protein
MLKRRWPVLVGPPLLILIVVAVGLAQPIARASRAVVVPVLRTCASAAEVSAGHAAPGAWWKTTENLDGSGLLLGRTLLVGDGAGAGGHLALADESSVSGPVDGVVLVTSDDGSRSQVRLASAAAGCDVLVDDRADVVRSAILDPGDGAVYAHLVGRDTRADLGTYRISPPGAGATESRLVAPPLPEDLGAHLGTVFGTVLRLDRGGTHLAVQSCTDLICLTRVFDLGQLDAAPAIVRGDQEGALIGFAGADLVTWGACTGLPCPVLAWNLATGHSRNLVGDASAAALTGDGRRLVALLTDDTATRPVEVDTASGRMTGLKGLPAGRLPFAGESSPDVGLEVADDEVAMTAPSGNPFAFRPDLAAAEALP